MRIADFLRLHTVRAPNIMWFLGAGASAAAGVPTAQHMIWEFKRILYCAEHRVSFEYCSDLGDPVLRARLQGYFDAAGHFPPEARTTNTLTTLRPHTRPRLIDADILRLRWKEQHRPMDTSLWPPWPNSTECGSFGR